MVRRRPGSAVLVLAVVVGLVAALQVSAAAMVPPDLGAWRGPASMPTTSLVSPVASVGFPLPAESGSGRRVVYSQTSMHVWAVNAGGHVVRDWKVSGRPDWPRTGTYHVFSKALWSRSSVSDVGFQWMVRFAHGRSTNIGFHSIPYDSSGRLIQTVKQLGHAVKGGGCIRSQAADAEWLYRWAGIGTTVVVTT